MITPGQIKARSLSTAQSGGYEKEEVNELLLEVIESYEAVFNENKELYRKMDVLATKIEEYRAEEDSIKTALITAQKMADRVTKEANENSNELITNSKTQAEDTINSANEQADKIISEARNYAGEFTKERQETAEKIINEAEATANEAINSAKIVARNFLNDAKEMCEELISKAKEEKIFYQETALKLKGETSNFNAKMIALYRNQIETLTDIAEYSPSIDYNDKKITSNQSEIDEIYSHIDEINRLADDAEKALDEKDEMTSQIEEVEEIQEVKEVEEAPATEEIVDDAPNETDEIEEIEEVEETQEIEAPKEAVNTTKTNINDIIDEVNEIINDDDSEPVSDVTSALDAFSADEITPLDEDVAPFPEIDEEPEMQVVEPIEEEEDEHMPFEDFFNIAKEEHRTDETISLIPPDDDEDEDDEPKSKGFFKRKNKN